jgi:hypothetical protein
MPLRLLLIQSYIKYNIESPCMSNSAYKYEGVSKSFRTGYLERELQMVQLSATRCSCITILWVSLVSFAAITLFVASQRVFIIVSVYLVSDSIRKLLGTPSYSHNISYDHVKLVCSFFAFKGLVPLATSHEVQNITYYNHIHYWSGL